MQRQKGLGDLLKNIEGHVDDFEKHGSASLLKEGLCSAATLVEVLWAMMRCFSWSGFPSFYKQQPLSN